MTKHQFLFINKDAKSDSLSHSARSERVRIHSHVQLTRKHEGRGWMPTRRMSEQLPFLDTSQCKHQYDEAPRPLPIFITGQSPPLSGSGPGSSLISHRRREGIDVAKKDDLSEEACCAKGADGNQPSFSDWATVAPTPSCSKIAICTVPTGKEHVIDPFQASCVKINAEVHRLLQYFVIVSYPNTFVTQARINSKRTYYFESTASALVGGCISNEVNMYTMLASMASQMRYLDGVASQGDPSPYIQKAITALQTHLSLAKPIDQRLIFNTFQLACAEFFRFDTAASLVHLKAVKFMINRLGGLQCIDSSIAGLIILGDGYAAAETLSKPMFSAAEFDPGDDETVTQFGITSMRSLCAGENRLGSGFLVTRHKPIVPSDLSNIIMDLTVCLSIFKHQIRNQPTQASKNISHWLTLRNLAIRHRLLSIEVQDPRTHVLRVALLIWILLATSVSGRKRSIKFIAPKLQLLLTDIENNSNSNNNLWTDHQDLRAWILMVGAMALPALKQPDLPCWFTDQLLLCKHDEMRDMLRSKSEMIAFSNRFFYLDIVQDSLMDDLSAKLNSLALSPGSTGPSY